MILFMYYQILTIYLVVKDMITECHDFNNRSGQPVLSFFCIVQEKTKSRNL